LLDFPPLCSLVTVGTEVTRALQSRRSNDARYSARASMYPCHLERGAYGEIAKQLRTLTGLTDKSRLQRKESDRFLSCYCQVAQL
jgi:hypothetical protein